MMTGRPEPLARLVINDTDADGLVRWLKAQITAIEVSRTTDDINLHLAKRYTARLYRGGSKEDDVWNYAKDQGGAPWSRVPR